MTPRVFESTVDGKILTFGVSGMFLNSDTVIYDRETKSLWNQFDGQALAGPDRDLKLAMYPLQFMRWADWIKQYPATLVLSEQTGFDRHYDEFPYGDYENTQDIYFPLENTDSRRKSKEFVFGITIGRQAKVYPQLELKKALPNGGTLNDNFAGKKLRLDYTRNVLTVVDLQTNKEFPVNVSYYFAWVAFHPDTEIYQTPAF
jgi:hypothetical protein